MSLQDIFLLNIYTNIQLTQCNINNIKNMYTSFELICEINNANKHTCTFFNILNNMLYYDIIIIIIKNYWNLLKIIETPTAPNKRKENGTF